jgi:uncharacterized membrane protein HdeD (DUF308 family)
MTTAAWEVETQDHPWWLDLIAGIFNLIVGILLLTNPAKTTVALTWVLGFYWFAQGILVLVGMFLNPSGWGWKLFMGILGTIAGIIVMRQPIASAVAIPSIFILLLGIQGLIVGGIALITVFQGGGWGAGVFGVLSLLFGITLILNYANFATVVTFIWIAAFLSTVSGIVQIILAFGQRRVVRSS